MMQAQIASMQEQVTALDQTTKVEEYKEVQVVLGDLKDIFFGNVQVIAGIQW